MSTRGPTVERCDKYCVKHIDFYCITILLPGFIFDDVTSIGEFNTNTGTGGETSCWRLSVSGHINDLDDSSAPCCCYCCSYLVYKWFNIGSVSSTGTHQAATQVCLSVCVWEIINLSSIRFTHFSIYILCSIQLEKHVVTIKLKFIIYFALRGFRATLYSTFEKLFFVKLCNFSTNMLKNRWSVVLINLTWFDWEFRLLTTTWGYHFWF